MLMTTILLIEFFFVLMAAEYLMIDLALTATGKVLEKRNINF